MPAAVRTIVLLACAASFACSSGSSSAVAEQQPAFSVVAVTPPDGSLGVLWRAAIRVEFSEPILGLGLDELTVEDGAGPLGGYLETSIDGRVWTWRPVRDLPRGGHLQVRLSDRVRAASGARPATTLLASYRVLDHLSRDRWLLGNVQDEAIAALVWPSGRAAVAVGRAVHDLNQGPLASTILPLVGAPLSFVADGIGGYTVLARQGYVPFELEAARVLGLYDVRTSRVLVSTAMFGRLEHVGNGRGDCAVYSYAVLGTAAHEGLFLRNAVSGLWSEFPLADAGPFALRRLAIDGSGNLFLGFIDGNTGRLRLQRIDALHGTSAEFTVSEQPDDFRVAARADGEARIFWHSLTGSAGAGAHRRLSRRYRGGALLPAELLYDGDGYVDRAFAAAQGGAAVFAFTAGANELLYLQRFEPDGEVGEPALVGAGVAHAPSALGVAPRGEAIYVWVEPGPYGDEILAVRSWPGRAPEAIGSLYQVPNSELRIRELRVAVEDSGRVVIAFAEDSVGPVRNAKAVVMY